MRRKTPSAEVVFHGLWPQVSRMVLAIFRYDHDREDRLQTAALLLWEAANERNPVMVVRRRLIDQLRTEARRDRILKRIDIDPDTMPTTTSALVDLLLDATEDVKTAVRLALEEGYNCRGVKTTIRKRLSRLGWSSRRIREVWNDIRNALA